MRCSWRENGGEGSPGSAALSLYARNNILMKERPDSEVPTSGRAAELLASPPLRGRPLPPLHVAESAECAPCPDFSHHPLHHHTEPRSLPPPSASSRVAAAPTWEWGRVGVAPVCDGACTLSAWMLRCLLSAAGREGGGGSAELSCSPTADPRQLSPPLSAATAGQRQSCRDSAEAEDDSAETSGTAWWG